MLKILVFLFTFITFHILVSQTVSLPADLRQHNLTQFNSSLFNPAFSFGRNNPESISWWSRWQSQNIDTDPTTLFFNYTKDIGKKSAFGLGYFQHNTGAFFNTGGVVNYAHQIRFNTLVRLSFGANLFGFRRELVNEGSLPTPIPGIPQLITANDFILQFAPGLNLSIENFSFSLASENLFDYNFTQNESNTDSSDMVFTGIGSYDFPVISSDSTAFIRPSVYLRSIPNMDFQVGGNILFSTKKYWVQGGYNNFYGISAGAGVSIFNKLSLGALIEFEENQDFNTENSSFEIVASYFIGKASNRRKPVSYDFADSEEQLEKDASEEELLDKEQEKQSNKEVKALTAREKTLQKKKLKDSLARVKNEKKILARAKKEKAKKDKLAKKELEKSEALAENNIKEDQRLDSIQKAKDFQVKALAREKEAEEIAKKKAAEELIVKQANEKVKLQAGEKYQEIVNEDNLEPGFYLIANVFGTKRYFDAFMEKLRKKGIQPKSFYRSKNKYNYAYLGRYNTMAEARRARDSNFNQKYQEGTWIFRIK